MKKTGLRLLFASLLMVGIILLIKMLFIPLMGHYFIGNLITILLVILFGGGAFFTILLKTKKNDI